MGEETNPSEVLDSATVKAVFIPRFGAADVLEVREVPDPDPAPAPGEVLIDVAAAGLNFAEVTARQGLYPDAPKPPCIVGYEVSGTVAARGGGVESLQVGQRVLALTRFGGHASRVVAPVASVLAIPDSLSFADAAAIPVNYLTAHHCLFQVGRIHPGGSVLLHMAAGGVGTAVLQLLQTIPDVTVFGTASAPKHDYLRGLGCDHPIDYRSCNYADEVRRITDGRGVDLVLDPLGGRDWKTGWNLLAPAGMLVAYGFANVSTGGKRNVLRLLSQMVGVPFFTPLGAMDANRSMVGVNMGHLWDEIGILRPQMERLIELVEAGVVRPHVHAEVPFSRAAEAHLMLETGANRGKVVLIPEG